MFNEQETLLLIDMCNELYEKPNTEKSTQKKIESILVKLNEE